MKLRFVQSVPYYDAPAANDTWFLDLISKLQGFVSVYTTGLWIALSN